MSIALWCLFAAGLLHMISKLPLAQAQANSDNGYDNDNPRQQQAAMGESGQRTLAAHKNQIESFPIFAAGILAAIATGTTSNIIDYLAIAYIVARLLYLYCYVKGIATVRSLVWAVGFFSSLALLCSPAWA